jgi:alpha-tubulin suppressor-like RCC1 family protein/uncharacterized surface anchored protein
MKHLVNVAIVVASLALCASAALAQTATKVAAGGYHTCALSSGGGVLCWGKGGEGQLGNGEATDRSTPTPVSGLGNGAVAITVGETHSCALTATGGVVCWGTNGFGQLGDGTQVTRFTPMEVSGLTSGVAAVTAGFVHTCALTADGGVKCWGHNLQGQLGDGTDTYRMTPTGVSTLTSGVAAVAAGGFHTCALTTGGGVLCWGDNNWGQLGDAPPIDRWTPTPVGGLASNVTAIAAGGYHTCALTTGGAVKCWGLNNYGQLGDATTTDRAVPTTVSGLESGVAAVTAGAYHTCAVMASGAARCWGYNGNGRLGDATTTTRLTPTAVSGLSAGVTAVDGGDSHTCALTGDGLRCWGWNYYGQLGDGTSRERTVPTPVIGLSIPSITGTVTNELTGLPLANITVYVYRSGGGVDGDPVTTNASGVYAKLGLTTGTYFVRTENSAGYLDELYDNMPCRTGCTPTSGTAVPVTAGITTGGINFALVPGATISGTVTDAVTGAPLSGALVTASTGTGGYGGGDYTDASGAYSVIGLPAGTYYITADAYGAYVKELYDNVPCPGGNCPPLTAGTGVSVAAGGAVNGINFGLATGGTIAGTMRDAATGAPIASVLVNAYTATGAQAGFDYTDSSGVYAISYLSTGTYHLRTNYADGNGYLDELYDNQPCPFGTCPPVTTGTAVSVTSGATTSGIDFGLSKLGSISGTVTAEDTGLPLASAGITVYSSAGAYVDFTATNASGAYTLTDLPPGTYYVLASDRLGYLGEMYNDRPCPGGACTVTSGTGVTVTSGQTTSGVNFALPLGGTITGRVTDAATGAPLGSSSAVVYIYDGDGDYVAQCNLDASGTYVKAGLETGSYFVFSTNWLGYIDEVYRNKPCVTGGCTAIVTTGTPVNVTAGATTGGIDLDLVKPGTVTGTVTNAVTGAPIANVTVTIYRADGTSAGSATTNASGVYTRSGLVPDTYYARTSNSAGYVDEQYMDQACPAAACPPPLTATPVTVANGATTSGIDFALTPAGSISGTVTDAGSGAPLSGVTVTIYSAAGTSIGSATTNPSGAFTRTGLAPGTYYVRTSNSLGYIDELYSDLPCPVGTCPPFAAGASVAVTAGTATSDISFALALGGTVTGSVTDATSGAPLANVSVTVYTASGSNAGSATTNASGVYSKTGLVTGTYFVRTSNSLGYIDELYNNLPCPGGSCTVTAGSGVSVTAGVTTSGIDFGLVVGGSITGTVTAAGTGSPLANVSVSVYSANGATVGPAVTTNASGVFSKSGLATGTYFLRTSNTLGYLDELYNSLPCVGGHCTATTGTGVNVTTGSATAGVDFALDAGGVIAGSVVDEATGDPLSGVDVYVYDVRGSYVTSVTTNTSGAYGAQGLQSGTYFVLTMDEFSYLDEVFDNVPGWSSDTRVTSGTPVAVTAGTTTSGINFALAKGGVIAGHVTHAATGAPLTNINLSAFAVDGSIAREGLTDLFSSTGFYAIYGLPTGNYYVRTAYNSGYLDQLYDGLVCPSDQCPPTALATAVAVTVGETTGPIDFSLTPGETIAGTVTDAGTGVPLASVSVSIYNASGTIVGSAVTTNTSGAYTKNGLAPGSYYVRTSNTLGYVDEQYNDLPCPGGSCAVTAGTPVTVGADAVASGIDFALARGGTISGTVTDAATGATLGSITVSAYDAGGNAVGNYPTNASGVYAVGGLPTGAYTVRTSNTVGYVDEQYNSQTCPGGACPPPATATVVSVTAPATTSGVSFSLARGGVIAGTVTNASSGAPLAGVSVSVYDAGGTALGSAVTSNALGEYFKTGLPTGTYYVRTTNSLGYLDELYGNQPCPGGTCPPLTTGAGVGVTAGATTGGIDFGLALLGSVTGTVTDAGTGAPLFSVTVRFYDASGISAGTASTTTSGVFTKSGLATGTYYVRTSNSLGYADELYNDLPCPNGACAVTAGSGVSVMAGATTGGIDFGLALLGTVTGTVTDAGTGAPLANVSVQLYNASGISAGSASTNTSGVFTKSGLATGTYYVRTSNSLGYVDELYNNLPCPNGGCPPFATGAPVGVTAGLTTSGIDFGLSPLVTGLLTGTVTNAATGAPLRGVSVKVSLATATTVWKSATTDASGAFAHAGLVPGTYFVMTSNGLGYVDELYNNLPCAGSACPPPATGMVVAVAGGTTTGGIDFALSAGGTITGTVSDAGTGVPLDDVTVSVFSAGGGLVGEYTTNASGVYLVSGLPTGAFYLSTSNDLGYVDELYGGEPCAGGDCLPVATGTPVHVTVGSTVTGIDFGLDAPGRITGTVTATGTGAPLGNVSVLVYNASGTLVGSAVKTNASGVYVKTGLASGTYFVRTSNSIGYVDVLYGSLLCPGGACPTVTTGTRVGVAAGTTRSGIDLALPLGGTLSGTVTAAATGAPLANISVSVFAANGAAAGSASTNASGVYAATGLPTGTYYACTSNSLGYLDELHDNLPCPGGACTPTAGSAAGVTAGSTTAGIDFALAWGGMIAGTVTDAGTGVPLAGVAVSAYNASGAAVGSGTVDAAGNYLIAGLATGTYYVRTSNTLGYEDEVYNNLPCPGGTCPPVTTGSGVSVTGGGTTSGISFGLVPLGGFTGTVTDASTGAPLAGASVRAYTANGSAVGSSVTTNDLGAYTRTGLPAGTYYVRTSNTLGYVDEQYDNQPCPGGTCPSAAAGTAVTVLTGALTGPIDFALVPGGIITGTVTVAGTGAPLAGVSVQVYGASGNPLGGAVTTNAGGVYTKTGLPAGTCYVRTSNSIGYIDELYNNLACPAASCTVTTGTAVVVAAGSTTAGVDFSLAPGGTVSGMVTDEETGLPLANIAVRTYNASGTAVGVNVATNASGIYAKTGLPTGTYYVRTSNTAGYFDELFDNLPCPGGACTVTSGAGVSVTAGTTTAAVDFALTLGGIISGTVADAETGVPIDNAIVRIYDSSGSAVGGSLTTNESGGYASTGLTTGTYYVRASSSAGYLDELYSHLPCPNGVCTVTSGTGVGVTVGAVTRDIDFGLGVGGSITGTVTAADTGAALAAISVRVYDSSGSLVGSSVTTNASGVYTKTGLATGTYYVRTSNSLGYVDELYDNLTCALGTCTVTSGAGVGVTAGATRGGIDFVLSQGGSITGTVTSSATAAPLTGVSVYLYNASGVSVGSTVSVSSGAFSFTGVQGGTYYLRTSNGLGYFDELYNNLPCLAGSCTVTTGTGVAVSPGATASGITFALDPLGTITGAVTHAATGAPLGSVSVRIYRPDQSLAYTVSTNASGVYTRSSVPPGTYYVRTFNALGYLDEVFDNLPCPGGVCPPVTAGAAVIVTAGATTSGIDFSLAPIGGIGGDFTGDLTSDILWRHSTAGDLWLWPMAGGVHTAELYVSTVADPGWEIRGLGDQTGDGQADLLWRHAATGQLYLWTMNGSSVEAETYVGTVDTAFDIVGTGDDDGDGKSDILWRHQATGELWLWRMGGATTLSVTYVDTVDLAYGLQGSGDLNADRKADLVWQGAAGDVWVWLMNGPVATEMAYVTTVGDLDYRIAGVADYTGDGKADLLWHHATRGDMWLWQMDGAVKVSEAYVATVPETAYRIVGTGDYDGDGQADILWHHAVRGEVWVWLMNGAVKLSEHYVGAVPDTGYRVVK